MNFTPSTWRLKITKINPKKQSYGQNLPGNGDASNLNKKKPSTGAELDESNLDSCAHTRGRTASTVKMTSNNPNGVIRT